MHTVRRVADAGSNRSVASSKRRRGRRGTKVIGCHTSLKLMRADNDVNAGVVIDAEVREYSFGLYALTRGFGCA